MFVRVFIHQIFTHSKLHIRDCSFSFAAHFFLSPKEQKVLTTTTTKNPFPFFFSRLYFIHLIRNKRALCEMITCSRRKEPLHTDSCNTNTHAKEQKKYTKLSTNNRADGFLCCIAGSHTV